MKKLLVCLMLALPLPLQTFAVGSAISAEAEEAWKTEFNRVCGQTDNAADMSVDALKKAILECDALKPRIEALEATPRKVYLKRLQMCRNLFVYLLEGKENK